MNLLGLEAGTTYTIKVVSSNGKMTVEGVVKVSTDVPVFLFGEYFIFVANMSAVGLINYGMKFSLVLNIILHLLVHKLFGNLVLNE